MCCSQYRPFFKFFEDTMNDLSQQISTIDLIILGGYLAAVLILGFLFSRFSLKGAENFFLGGRKLPGWANGISYAATSMNADVPAAYCGMMATTGVFLAWFYLSRFGLALMIGGILFAVFWRKLKFFTAPEFYSLRFGKGIGSIVRVWVATRSAFIAMVAWTGAGLLGIHKITGQVLGWDIYTTLLITVPVVFIYVYFAGLAGVIATDIFQAIIMVVANIILVVAVLNHFGGPAELGGALEARFGSDVISNFPPINDERLGIIALLAWGIGTTVGYGGDTSPMSGAVEGQRLLSCRSTREAANMYFTTALALFLLLLLLTLPALGGILIWPEMRVGQEDPELIYGRLLSTFLGPGLLGLALAGLTASVMSTVSSNLNFGGQVIANDVYKHLIKKDADEKRMIAVGRIVMALIMTLSIIVALSADSLIGIAVFMLGLSSAELSANWAQWWWWRFNKWGRLAATFGGPVFFLLAKLYWEHTLPEEGLFRVGYLSVLSGIFLTTIFWVAVTLLTKPDDERTLQNFYDRARPLGFWEPMRKKRPGQLTRPKDMILQGFWLAFLGFASLCFLFLGLSDLFVGRFEAGALLISAAIALGVFFARRVHKFLTIIEAVDKK